MALVAATECPICGGKKFGRAILDKRAEKYAENTIWWGCLDCGLIFQSPHVSMEEIADFYKAAYRKPEYPTRWDRLVQLTRAHRQIELLKMVGRISAKTALDWGAASGVSLEELHIEYGCEVWGVELGKGEKERAAARGVQLVETLEQLPADIKFDIINLSHALEHVDLPVPFLLRLREQYASLNAHLIIEVPTTTAHSAWQPFHMTMFNPPTLQRAAEKAGWRPEKGIVASDGTLLWLAAINDGKPTDSGFEFSADNSGRYTGQGRQQGLAPQKPVAPVRKTPAGAQHPTGTIGKKRRRHRR